MDTYTEDEVIELLKRQRHSCQIEWNKRSYYDKSGWYIHCDDIMNAEMPKLKTKIEVLKKSSDIWQINDRFNNI